MSGRNGQTAKKRAKRPRLIPQPNGRGALLSGGMPGNKGGSGRPPDEFKQLCETLTLTAMREHVHKILQNPDHPHFMRALEWASAHRYGKPSQPVEHSGSVTLEDILSRVNGNGTHAER